MFLVLIELSLNEQKVKEYNEIVRENQKREPDLNFKEVSALEDVFIPYSKLPCDLIQIQKDYRSSEEFRGIYACEYGRNSTIAMLTDYKDVTDSDLQSPVWKQGYGVADNASQVLDLYDKLYAEYNDFMQSRDFVILMIPVFREDEPENHGWRWHKCGDYIGKFEPQHEYLRDEEGIDFVWVFKIAEVKKVSL